MSDFRYGGADALLDIFDTPDVALNASGITRSLNAEKLLAISSE